MREWLLKVAHTLEADISITRKYPYKPHEDHHHRFARVGLSTCAFLAGHIRVPSLRDRTNELKLGAVITTIREPYALLMSKYFHRTRLKLNQATLKKYMNPTSQPSRRWFFYFNDLDPCEQLRYYDGLEGCTITNSPALQKRVHAIADRIDCVVDTDDPGHDLLSLCSQMQMSDHECPKLLVENVNNGHSLYDTMLTLPHIKSVMSRAVNVTVLLREAFLRRRCRFLENGSLTTPGAEPPQWPFKRCKHIDAMDLSGNGDGVTDDAPENDAHDDDDLKPQVISDEGGAYATDVQDDTGEEEKKESESEGDKKKEAGGVVGNEASS